MIQPLPRGNGMTLRLCEMAMRDYKEAREFKSVQLKPLLGQLRTNLEKMKQTKLVIYSLRIFEEIELRLD